MDISPATPWIDDDAEDSFRQMIDQEEQMKNLPLDSPDDPLAASWASYHVWQKQPGRRWVPLNDVIISPHDRDIAETTRRYYRDKIAMQSLRQGEVSSFRQDLYDICNNGVIRHKHLGMIYRLPYFYVEDIERQKLKDATTIMPDIGSLPPYLSGKSTRRLRTHGKILHSRRARETMEYWYHDAATGYPVLWCVNYDNPLRSLVEYHFNKFETADIYAHWRLGHSRFDGFRFWMILDPEFR